MLIIGDLATYVKTKTAFVHRENNLGREAIPYALMMDHVLEGLVPTARCMDVRTGERICNMNAPKAANTDAKEVTKIKIDTYNRGMKVVESKELSYDWTGVVAFSGERNVICKNMIAFEKEGILEEDEKKKISVIRRMDERIDRVETEIDCYKVATVSANHSGYGKKVVLSSRHLMAKFFAKIGKKCKNGELLLSKKLTIPGMVIKLHKILKYSSFAKIYNLGINYKEIIQT